MAEHIDLKKRPVLDLQKDVTAATKAAGLYGQKARVALVIDKSGSMEGVYLNGQVQNVVDRVVAMALEFDDDGKAEVFAFHNGVVALPEVGVGNLATYVQAEVMNKVGWGGTEYAPVMRKVVDKYKSGSGGATVGSFFSKLVTKAPKMPTYVLFVTDGDNADHREAEALIREASAYPIFWQFVGIGHAAFTFLKRLDTMAGREVDNANFFAFFGGIPDEELYQKLLAEYPAWLKAAKAKGIL